jgi:hypothetical protein
MKIIINICNCGSGTQGKTDLVEKIFLEIYDLDLFMVIASSYIVFFLALDLRFLMASVAKTQQRAAR